MKQSPAPVPLVDGITLFFMALAVASGLLLWFLHGGDHLAEAARGALVLMLAIGPIVLMAVLMGAYVQALVPPSIARRWIGQDSGLRGLLLATLAGAVTPGGPFAAFPLVVGLYRAGASLAVCVTYVTAWGAIGLQRVLVWEIAFFGIEFTLIRVLVSLPLPIIAGLITASLLPTLRDD
ncbi:uncharacterized membrane protein YraQ (UPF0718 family) [Natronocella acetinitrilica]|jgi:uncharacterized membrane protein YraQ (UPF0718 family)|uniref:Uncharacterized membrane protein YraQ (UPF0718 family) n=1 Tax=Natronocella acetinitrilica TaxID=414046 RepID=A0AAE3G6J4_9GAMM|nr:permease [Natronocella acetinitrilica]MCP1675959.1 uncharacterized membrane protein YraQ (UPF0718 family) [Natronocella acetinitrilica]